MRHIWGPIMKYIEIKLSRCRLFLSEAEIASLLAHDQRLWTEAMKRGKEITRARNAAGRQAKISPEKRGI